jgi:hypothetical protein
MNWKGNSTMDNVNTSIMQDAINQLKLADQILTQELPNANPQQQQWIQQVLGAVKHAKDVIDVSMR